MKNFKNHFLILKFLKINLKKSKKSGCDHNGLNLDFQ